MYFLFQLERESLDQDNHLFTAELNYIIINALFPLFFLSFSTYWTVYNEFVLATFNLNVWKLWNTNIKVHVAHY